MAEFEGEKNLNRETSELEVKGKFKLSEEELDNVAGGCGFDGIYKEVGFWCPNCKKIYYWENTAKPAPQDCPYCTCGTQMVVSYTKE